MCASVLCLHTEHKAVLLTNKIANLVVVVYLKFQ